MMTDHRMIVEALQSAPPAPRGLLYLATFNQAQRRQVAADPALLAVIRESNPADWQTHFDHQTRKNRALVVLAAPDASGMRLQAIHDLRTAADSLASLSDGRRGAIFTTAARMAKYVANAVLTAAEVQEALGSGWIVCGGAAKYGQAFAAGAIRRALDLGRNDPLPPLARQFRDAATANLGARHG